VEKQQHLFAKEKNKQKHACFPVEPIGKKSLQYQSTTDYNGKFIKFNSCLIDPAVFETGQGAFCAAGGIGAKKR